MELELGGPESDCAFQGCFPLWDGHGGGGCEDGAVAPGSCCPSNSTNVQDTKSLSWQPSAGFIIPCIFAVGETEARGS